MNTSKWVVIAMVGFFITAMTSVSIESYVKNTAAVEKVKAGLEECPNLHSRISMDTIWVKDCKMFIETYENTKEKDK